MADLIRVRATINLRKLGAGSEALVDPSNPYIALCLKKGLLVPLDAQTASAEAAASAVEPPADRAPDIPADEGPVNDVDESAHPEVADLE